MTHGKRLQHPHQVDLVLVERICKMLLALSVFETHISHTKLLKVGRLHMRVTSSVRVGTGGELLEFHYILGKGACLVGENVVDCA